jgi:hypothetical protein
MFIPPLKWSLAMIASLPKHEKEFGGQQEHRNHTKSIGLDLSKCLRGDS